MSRAHDLAETVAGWPLYPPQRDALSELERLATDAERYRQALERVYQIGRGPHVEIARDALNGEAFA